MLSPMEPHGTIRFELWEKSRGKVFGLRNWKDGVTVIWEWGRLESILGGGQLEVKFCAYEVSFRQQS